MKIAIAAVIVKNRDERVGNVNVHQVRDNQITCSLYHMKYYIHSNPFPAFSSSVAVRIISCPGERLFQREDTKR